MSQAATNWGDDEAWRALATAPVALPPSATITALATILLAAGGVGWLLSASRRSHPGARRAES